MTSMMDHTFSLYDDLPLFSGDLLVGWSPLADELPALAENELQHNETFYTGNWNADFDLVKGHQISEPKQDSKASSIPSVGKMLGDTNVNLFDLLRCDQHNSPVTELPLSTDNLETLRPEDLLNSVSEILASNVSPGGLLMNNSNNITSLSELSNTIYVNISDDSGVFSGEDVDSFFSENVDQVETILSSGSNDLVANILSPVSPEDVDFILSSGPTSPYSTDAGSPADTDAGSPADSTIYNGSDLMSPCSSIDTSYEMNAEPSDFDTSDVDVADDITISMKYLKQELLKPTPSIHVKQEPLIERRAIRHKSQRQRVRQEPYSPPAQSRQWNRTSTPVESVLKPTEVRKQRKKQQNKNAALRYRHKKKEEKLTSSQECELLEDKNNKLHEKVDSMTREIQYLKDLLAEVYQAKASSTSKLCK